MKSGIFFKLQGPKTRAAVDYTLTGWEPHRDPVERVANSHTHQY